eukprot:scpid51271/ scgid33906/ 
MLPRLCACSEGWISLTSIHMFFCGCLSRRGRISEIILSCDCTVKIVPPYAPDVSQPNMSAYCTVPTSNCEEDTESSQRNSNSSTRLPESFAGYKYQCLYMYYKYVLATISVTSAERQQREHGSKGTI